jgi:hypothetical protein
LSRPLTFPRLTRSEAQALASLATQGPGHLLDALPAGQSGRLRLAPLPPGQDLQQAQGSQRLHLEWAGGQMALDLAPWVIDRWLLMTLDVAESATLPAPFRQAALDHVIAWVAQALGRPSCCAPSQPRRRARPRHRTPWRWTWSWPRG